VITQVMKFGVRSIIEHDEEAREAMFHAHRLYNDVMEVQLDARAAYRQVRSEVVPDLQRAEEELERLDGEAKKLIKNANGAKERKKARLSLSPEDRKRLDEIDAKRKEENATAKRLRKEFKDLMDPANEEYQERTSGADRKLFRTRAEIGRQLKAAKRIPQNPEVKQLKMALEAVKDKIKEQSIPAGSKKEKANNLVSAEMLSEPKWPDTWKRLHATEREKHARIKELCRTAGLGEATKKSVIDAVEQALKTAEGDPGFRRYDGGRKIGVRIRASKASGLENGMGVQEAFLDGETRFRLSGMTPPPGRREDPKPRQPNSRRSRARYAVASFPIGVREGKKWISVEAIIDRPIPEDAVILYVYLVPRRIGFRMSYSLQLTIQTKRPLVQRTFGKKHGEVHVRFHAEPGGSGVVVAEIDGKPFALDGPEFRSSAKFFDKRGGALSAMHYCRVLRTQADQIFEKAKWILDDWRTNDACPDWLRAELGFREKRIENGVEIRGQKDLKEWRDHGRLAVVSRMWVDAVFGDGERNSGDARCHELWKKWRGHQDGFAKSVRYGDRKRGDYYTMDIDGLERWLATHGVKGREATVCFWLELWRRKDWHLRQWAADSDARGRRCRKDQYRVKASALAKEYASLVVHQIDLGNLRRKRKPLEEKDELHEKAKRQLLDAAPGEFIDCLKAVFGDRLETARKTEKAEDRVADGVAAE